MRMTLIAGAALALSACSGGGNSSEANQANGLSTDNMMMDQNLLMDQNVMGQNMSGDEAAAMGANGAADANTQNMMRQDATTNDPDTNLANGL